MWLADISSSSDVDQKPVVRPFRSTSPPLEGGESLCELYVECLGTKESNIAAAEANSCGPKECSELVRNEGIPSNPENLKDKNLFSLLRQELPVNTFTQTFLQSILSSVDSQDPVVAGAWVETLLDVIDLLPKEIIKNEILTLAVNKGQMSQPVASRLLCCRMLGKLCTKFDPYVIKKEVLPVVLSLCQDLDYEVRGCMCRQLDIVARGIGLEAAKNAILPELVELSNDEESFVRLAAIETVVQMLPVLDDETCIQAIIPLVQKFCEKSISTEDSTLPVVAKQLGRLCHGLSINLTDCQRSWFLSYFCSLANLGLGDSKRVPSNPGFFSPMPDLVPELENKDRLTQCRYACAYNFPAMVLFAGPTRFHSDLHETYSQLCSDPYVNVKKTMASGFYEVVKLLNLLSPLLMPELICLLNNDSIEVLKGIIPNLPEILKVIYQPGRELVETKEQYTPGLVQAIISCEVTTSISSNWRLHAELLTQISCVPQCLSPDVIYKNFVPLLLIKMNSTRAIPCRTASAYSLLVLLRHTPKLEQRNGIIEELIKDLCHGKSCHKRMLFIKVCDLVLQLFSKAFFKKHFFRPVLSLCEDRVPNIRLRMCTLLPKLKSLVKLPKDGALLQSLETCVRNLMTSEKDRDVTAAVTKALEELDKIEVPSEPVMTRRLSLDVEAYLEDMRKEEEENRLINLEFSGENFPETRSATPSATPPSNCSPRHGKIPVRKSGTLPKSAKAKEFKSSTLTRGTSQINISNRFSRCFRPEDVSSLSSPKKTVLKSNPVSRETSPKLPQKCLLSPVRHSSRPGSPLVQRPPLCQDSTSSSVSKKLTTRCPSPIPPPPVDNRLLLQAASLLTQDGASGRCLSQYTSVPKPDFQRSETSSNVAKKPGTPLPSPGMTRKLPSSSSKIPMPSSK